MITFIDTEPVVNFYFHWRFIHRLSKDIARLKITQQQVVQRFELFSSSGSLTHVIYEATFIHAFQRPTGSYINVTAHFTSVDTSGRVTLSSPSREGPPTWHVLYCSVRLSLACATARRPHTLLNNLEGALWRIVHLWMTDKAAIVLRFA